jgi:hypothetical protein
LLGQQGIAKENVGNVRLRHQVYGKSSTRKDHRAIAGPNALDWVAIPTLLISQ